MARPRKRRMVCRLPESDLFGPLDKERFNDEFIVMTVDEYETIRLIDYEGLIQEQCAEQMDVGRTTVQRIYNDARKKLALALVEGRQLRIVGGDYKLCGDATRSRGCGRGRGRCNRPGYGQRRSDK